MVRFLESQVNKFCDILNSMTEASGELSKQILWYFVNSVMKAEKGFLEIFTKKMSWSEKLQILWYFAISATKILVSTDYEHI